MPTTRTAVRTVALLFVCAAAIAQEKPRITLQEFFDSVAITKIRISPRGDAVVVATSRPDWNASRFRHDLWIVRQGSEPRLLTTSGHDSDPEWSPDGNWIALVSDRKSAPPTEEQQPATTPAQQPAPTPEQPAPKPTPTPTPKKPPAVKPSPEKPKAEDMAGRRDDEDEEKPEEISQLYVLPMNGGEPVQITTGRESVHAFAWALDSQSLYVATRVPQTKQQLGDHKKEWKDVERYREDERGDIVNRILLRDAIAHGARIAPPTATTDISKKLEAVQTIPSKQVTTTPYKISDLQLSPDGNTLAFATDSRSSRIEDIASYEIYLTNAGGGAPRQLTHNEAIERRLRWSPDGKRIFFSVDLGSVEEKYRDVQGRVYAVDVNNGNVQRYASDFPGAIQGYELASDGALVALGRVGTQVALYTQATPDARFTKAQSWEGTYEDVSLSHQGGRIALLYSTLQKPTEVYLANSIAELANAQPVTHFNQFFTERALPQGKPYQWKSDDGTTVEGMLIYPPGKFGAKNLRMLTLIHGGPADADGDTFGANWYDWAILAASNDWLVFRPNYRGSTGYGDQFQLQIVPKIVSVPGRDILTGVDALVRDGIADPKRLAVGGYSYGGYMTNWLITQTTEFKAAVTGAGAVEHAANWGNDDLSFDDAWYLGGVPWQAKQTYDAEAALWQINKVRTPTHMVAGADDIRVAVLESYLMERAFQNLNIPHSLLIFPGEGHGLRKNPWHGRIKVREELNWLEKFIPKS
jgi:dipeptidyl aminopeptidase/acylaminoacyl peptidase